MQFTQDDLLAASKLLNKELKVLQSIFECYPSFSSTARASRMINSNGAVKGSRHAETCATYLTFNMYLRSFFGYCNIICERFWHLPTASGPDGVYPHNWGGDTAVGLYFAVNFKT